MASWTLAGIAVAYGLWFAILHEWVCDDAFISYRYSENFAAGLGLVFNAGEQVEGYTNFLWVLLLSGGILLGVDPVPCSQVLGVGFFAATIVVLVGTARRWRVAPVAAIGFALHTHAAYFATCGLETSMFVFFVTVGLVTMLSATDGKRFGLAGLALILATMTRPDGAVFYACASGVALGVSVRKRGWGPLIWFAAPFVVLYVPYFVWKCGYYGYPVPNTFYAKSASEPYPDQGLYYIWLFFSCYWYLVPALVLPVWWLLRGRPREGAKGCDTVRVASRIPDRAPGVLALFSLPFLAYVTWVGGDFMFGRFCMPVLPSLLLGLQLAVVPRSRAGSGTEGRRGLVIAVAVILGSFFTLYPVYTKDRIVPGNPRNVVEERDHYPRWYVDSYRILGETLSRILGPDLRVAVGGGQAMLGYFGRFATVLEIHGLTDEFIAHRDIETRGRVGHEKALPFDHAYYSERGIHFVVGAFQRIPVPGDRLAELRVFEFWAEDVPFFGKPITNFAQATMLTYDDALMAPLIGREDVRFTPFPTWLDGYIERMEGLDKAEVRKDLAAFDAFYFEGNEDLGRRSKIEQFLARFP